MIDQVNLPLQDLRSGRGEDKFGIVHRLLPATNSLQSFDPNHSLSLDRIHLIMSSMRS